MKMNNKPNQTAPLTIGWASRDITPCQPVVLGGQHKMRISEGVNAPVTVNALALTAGDSAEAAVIFVSCDIAGFRHRWYEENDFLVLVQQAVRELDSAIDVERLILNATHTHTAPNALVGRYGDATPEGVMTADEYMELLRNRIAEVVVEAWHNRKPGGVSFGLGTAVVGHNRRAVYFAAQTGSKGGDTVMGLARMYGKTDDPDFSHIEGYEDHYVDLLYTWDENEELTGVVVNLACPSQETEHAMTISSDFWHEVRVEIRRRHGDHIQILAQCATAGDQSPHRLWYKHAENRMLELRGFTMRQEIGRRLANAVDEVLPIAKQDIRSEVPLQHVVRTIQLPRRMVTDEEAKMARKDLAGLEAEAAMGVNNVRLQRPCKRVLERYEFQNQFPFVEMDLHVVRIGDIAFATNRFELFLDYGIRIKGRSPAIQTFLIQLTASKGWTGNYLPSERAMTNKGYGSSVYNSEIGAEGGQIIVEETVKTLNELWQTSAKPSDPPC